MKPGNFSFCLLWVASLVVALLPVPLPAGQKDKPMNEAFHNAITAGDTAQVKALLQTDHHLAQIKDEKGVSAILKATYHGRKEILAMLLETHPELTIFEASATGETERVQALLKTKPKLANEFAPDGFTPLGLAVFFGHQPTVEALLTAGAKVNTPSRESMKVTPLHSAAAAKQLSIARLLLEKGANVNAESAENGFTPLHEAASNGDLEFAKLLIEKGANVNAKMKNGKTPLGLAIGRERSEMAEFLRQHGAN